MNKDGELLELPEIKLSEVEEFFKHYFSILGFAIQGKFEFVDSWQEGAFETHLAIFMNKFGDKLNVKVIAHSTELVEGDFDEYLGHHHENYINHKVDLRETRIDKTH